MKRTSFPVPEDASVSSKRKTRSDRPVDLLNRNDLQALREFSEGIPKVAVMGSFAGLDREQPALLQNFTAVEYKDKDRQVKFLSRGCFVFWFSELPVRSPFHLI